MRQTKYPGHQSIVLGQVQFDQFDHGVGKQRSCFGQCAGMAAVHQQHVTARQQTRIRTEHGMNRADFQPGRGGSAQPIDQRRLDRSDIEYQRARGALDQRIENFPARLDRRGNDDQLDILGRFAPIAETALRGRIHSRIGHQWRIPLAVKKPDQPGTEPTGTADHQRALALALSGQRDALGLLPGQRSLDQCGKQGFGHVRIQTQAGGMRANSVEHLALTAKIAQLATSEAFGPADFGNDTLTLRGSFDQFAVDPVKLGAQSFKVGNGVVHGVRIRIRVSATRRQCPSYPVSPGLPVGFRSRIAERIRPSTVHRSRSGVQARFQARPMNSPVSVFTLIRSPGVT